MPKDNPPRLNLFTNRSALRRLGPPRALFTLSPKRYVLDPAKEAAELMECARFLNFNGVMHANQDRIAASSYISAMVRTLLDHAERQKMCSAVSRPEVEAKAP